VAESDAKFEPEPSLFRLAVEVASDGVVITDATRDDHPVVWVSPAFERLTGYRASEIVGRNLRVLQGEDADQPERVKLRRAIADSLPCSVVLRNYRKDGSLFWNELSMSPVRDRTGRVARWIGFLRDVSARTRLERAIADRDAKLAEAQELLDRLATRDPLTGVASRSALVDTFAREWKRAARELTPLSLIVVDIDAFRSFNESHGAGAADECLRQVASGLEGTLKRPADLLARSGGDEFIALLPATDDEGARFLGETMRQRIRDLQIGHHLARAGVVTLSVGIASGNPSLLSSGDELMARAGKALQRARVRGGDRVESWTVEEVPAVV
jgi:diguanylate cyclase (GGDEF)-like protein/PAS domain S-box-containing protein